MADIFDLQAEAQRLDLRNRVIPVDEPWPGYTPEAQQYEQTCDDIVMVTLDRRSIEDLSINSTVAITSGHLDNGTRVRFLSEPRMLVDALNAMTTLHERVACAVPRWALL